MISLRRFLKRCFPHRPYQSEFSETEINAIKDSWARLGAQSSQFLFRARHAEIGKRILFSLIDKKPNFADYYGIEINIPEHEILANKSFNLQAERIQKFFDTVVSYLGCCSDSAIHSMAHRIGQIHYHRGVNFGADNWLVFKKVTVDRVVAHQSRKSFRSFSTISTVDSSLSMFDGLQNTKTCLVTIVWNKLMTVIIREMKRGFLQEAQRNCQEKPSEEQE